MKTGQLNGIDWPRVDELLAAISSRWGDAYGLAPDATVRCSVAADQHGRWRLLVVVTVAGVRVAGSYSLPDHGGLQPSLAAFLEDMGNERI